MSLRSFQAHLELTGSQGSQEPLDLLARLDQMVTCSALKEQKEEWAILGLPVSQGLVDRKDGKVKLVTVNVQTASGVFQDCQEPRGFQVSMGIQGGKVTKENLASMASLGSLGSREPLVMLEFLGPKE